MITAQRLVYRCNHGARGMVVEDVLLLRKIDQEMLGVIGGDMSGHGAAQCFTVGLISNLLHAHVLFFNRIQYSVIINVVFCVVLKSTSLKYNSGQHGGGRKLFRVRGISMTIMWHMDLYVHLVLILSLDS